MDTTQSLFAAALAVEITPPIGIRMDGYAARQYPAQAIHDPLYATLLVLKSSQGGVALVSLDVLMISLAFTKQVRAALAPILGLKEDSVMVAAIHTHAGPAGYMLSKMPLLETVEDPGLLEMTLRKLTGAAEWAARHLQPAVLRLGRGSLNELGRNRNDPAAPIDDALTVVRVDDEAGQPLAVLLNFGCHPTVLGPDNLEISADYPGAARAALCCIYPETVFLFFNGASGDISTRFTRRGQGFDEVERMGHILAGEALKVMQTAAEISPEPLGGVTQALQLQYRHFPTPEEARQQSARLEADLDQMRAEGRPAGDLRKAVTRVEGAQAQVIMAEAYGNTAGSESEMQVLRIGDLAVIGLPGEPFTRIVLDIKANSPLEHTIVFSYANDYSGYFPDRASVLAGTYEALISPYDENVGEQLAQTALKHLQKD